MMMSDFWAQFYLEKRIGDGFERYWGEFWDLLGMDVKVGLIVII